jgi:hypothetical protein
MYRAVILRLPLTEKGDLLPWLVAGLGLVLVGAGMLAYRYIFLSAPCPPLGCNAARGGSEFVAIVVMLVAAPFLIQAYRVQKKAAGP